MGKDSWSDWIRVNILFLKIHAENIIQLAEIAIANKIEFSNEAEKDLVDMLTLADKTVEKALYALEHHDLKTAEEVLSSESELDRMENTFRKAHINRLNQNYVRYFRRHLLGYT